MSRNILLINLRSSSGFTAPFAETDYGILAEKYNIDRLEITVKNMGAGGTVENKGEIIGELNRFLPWADAVYIWFADLHAWSAMKMAAFLKYTFVMKKRPKFIVVIGGYEVDTVKDFPEYGLTSTWKRHLVSSILNHADRIIVPSQYLFRKVQENYGGDITPEVVPLGFDQEKYPLSLNKKPSVVSVTVANSTDYARLKGVYDLFTVARNWIEVEFTVVGIGPQIYNDVLRDAPPNVNVLSVIPQSDLVKLYQDSKIYCQFSFTEAFGASIAESMLCGCIPVCRRAGAMSEVTGTTRTSFDRIGRAHLALSRALINPDWIGAKARNLIIEKFHIKRREEHLIRIIEEVCT